MKIKDIWDNRETREDLKDKFEVVMAVIVLSSFIYKKVTTK